MESDNENFQMFYVELTKYMFIGCLRLCGVF